MSKYSVIILPKATNGLSRIDKHIAKRITDKLTWLSENVEIINTLPLAGELSGLFKIPFYLPLIFGGLKYEGLILTTFP